MGGRRWRSVTLGIVAVGLVATCGVTVAGARLAACFRPHAPGADAALLSASGRWTRDLVSWQGRLTAVLLVSALATLALVVVGRGGIRTRRTAIVTAGAAVILGSLAAATKGMVQFDQIALWSVTVGEDIDGYWFAAFGDDVRFVLVDNVEVSQPQYAGVLLTHLLAPVLAGVALLVVGLSVWRAPRRTDRTAP